MGDDDQAIYGFRGSDPRAFTRFSAIWTGHETIPLTEHYRSTPEIIRAANKVISGVGSRFAPDKEIIAALADHRHLENLSGLSEETIALLYDWYCCGFSSPSGSLMP